MYDSFVIETSGGQVRYRLYDVNLERVALARAAGVDQAERGDYRFLLVDRAGHRHSETAET